MASPASTLAIFYEAITTLFPPLTALLEIKSIFYK